MRGWRALVAGAAMTVALTAFMTDVGAQKSQGPPGWAEIHSRRMVARAEESGTLRVVRSLCDRFFSRTVMKPPSKSTSESRIRINSDRRAPV